MKSIAHFATFAATSLLSGVIALAPNPTQAINLELINSFDGNSADGITFDPASGNLFTAETVVIDFPLLNPDGFDVTIREIDPATGATINAFKGLDDELTLALGISILPNGNLITSDVIPGRIVEISTTGEIVPGGIDLQSPQLSFLTPGGQDPTGIRFNPVNNTIFTANFLTGDLLEIATELDSDGNIVIESSIALNDLVPGITASGLEIDPETGNFLIAGDIDSSNAIHEVTPDGRLLNTFNVSDFGFQDPEGLAIDPATRILYVSFDDDSLAGLEVTQGDKIAAFQITSVPEPTSILGLLAFGALSITSAMKGKKDRDEKNIGIAE